MRKDYKIGIIGFGNMGFSIGKALQENGWTVYVYDKDKRKTLKKKNFFVCRDFKDLFKRVPVLIIAIKPQDIFSFIEKTKNLLLQYNPLVISIAAGVPTVFFENIVRKIRVVRAMPNLAVKQRLSISFLSKGKYSNLKDYEVAKNIFNSVGKSILIKENLLDKVTAISGSGPGWEK